MQFDHGKDHRVGSTPIGVFTDLSEDDHGLRVQARIFDNPVVEPVRQAIEGGAIKGMSFKFQVVRDEWRDNAGKLLKAEELSDLLWDAGDRAPLSRTIKEVKLYEAGPVVFPAYTETSVGVRSLDETDRADLIAQYAQTNKPTPTAEEDTRAADVETEAATETPDRADQPVTPSGHVSATTTGAPRQTPVRQLPTQTTRKERVPMDAMSIEEREARLSEIRSRLSEIDTEYSGAALPRETQDEWDSLNAEHVDHEMAIDAANLRAEQLAKLAKETRNVERGTPFSGSPAFHPGRTAQDVFDLNEIRNSARGEEDHVRLLRQHALRAVELSAFPGSSDRSAAQSAVERLLTNVDDERCTLARRILTTGSAVYERAFGKTLVGQALTAEEARALSLTDAAGGYAVPFQLDPTVILTSSGSKSPIRQISRVVQVTGKEWQGITSAGITVSRDAEAAEVSDDSPSFGQPVIRPTRVAGFVPFSVELDQDWGSLRSELTGLLSDAKTQEENVSFITGTGTPPAPGGVVATLNSSSHVTAGGTAAFAAADVYALENAVPNRFRDNAVMLASKSIYNRVRQFDTAGGAQLWERIGKGMPNELLGYPAYEASAMATALTTGQLILLMGDFSQFLIVDRVGMSVELVPHLLGSNRRPTGERGIYAIWRNSSKILTDAAFRLLKTG
jgi:HK97 family phage major capsid protein/HK97 family phage prohead protease